MRFIFIVLIVFSSIIAFSQEVFSYNQLINRAELNVVDSEYNAALTEYEGAFKVKQNSFAKDLFNAALCAIKINQFGKADRYLHTLGILGYYIDSLATKPAFINYVKSPNYTALKKQLDKAICNVPYNPIYKEKLLQIVDDDQMFRIRNPRDYTTHEYNGVIKLLDSINVTKFLKLINEYEYPNEQKIGIVDNQLVSRTANVLVQHQQFGAPNRVVDYSPVLLIAIKNAEINENNGISMYNLSSGRDSLFGTNSFFYLEQNDGSYKYGYYEKFKNGLEERFNQNRKNYGLESLEDYRKKVKYFLTNKDFYQDYNIGVMIEKIPKEYSNFYKDIIYF